VNSEDELLAVQKGLRGRFDDFRRALERREDDACRLALADFHAQLTRWTAAEERVLLPALSRTYFPGRDPQRELRLEYVQIRELTRYLLSQIGERAPLADVLGLVENLERRLAAHESEMEKVYYPSAAPLLTPDEWRLLGDSAPPP
jgi:Hemerythrin HHE cation binding domain